MNTTYIYPQNLEAKARLWLWDLKDLIVIGAAALISLLALSQIRFVLPMVGTMLYAFLTIRLDDTSILDFIKRATRFFVTTQQYYEWRIR